MEVGYISAIHTFIPTTQLLMAARHTTLKMVAPIRAPVQQMYTLGMGSCKMMQYCVAAIFWCRTKEVHKLRKIAIWQLFFLSSVSMGINMHHYNRVLSDITNQLTRL